MPCIQRNMVFCEVEYIFFPNMLVKYEIKGGTNSYLLYVFINWLYIRTDITKQEQSNDLSSKTLDCPWVPTWLPIPHCSWWSSWGLWGRAAHKEGSQGVCCSCGREGKAESTWFMAPIACECRRSPTLSPSKRYWSWKWTEQQGWTQARVPDPEAMWCCQFSFKNVFWVLKVRRKAGP